MKLVHFLTTSAELKTEGYTPVNIHVNAEAGFQSACYHGHVEMAKFLTTSLELKAAGQEWVDIHEWNDRGFEWACQKERVEVIQWWLFELSEHPKWKDKQGDKAVINETVKAIARLYPLALERLQSKEEYEAFKNRIDPLKGVEQGGDRGQDPVKSLRL